MRFKNLVLASSAAAALALSATAAAAEPDGWYGAIDLGGHWADDVDTDSEGPITVHWDWEVNQDWAAFARVGYRLNPNWRVELEGGMRLGNIGTVRNSDGSNTVPSGLCNQAPASGPCWSPDGDMTALSMMGNVIYDFGGFGSFRPFVGVGAGAVEVTNDAIGTLRGDRTRTLSVDESSLKFGWQALAGFAYPLGERANIDLTYRYLSTDIEWETSVAPGTDIGQFGGDYEDHSVTVGLRYAFSSPPAPPPPPPPPPPPVTPPPPPPPPPVVTPPPPPRPAARQFVVYFEWDRSDLTADAQAVVRSAADYAKSGRPTRVLVIGHADTSGSQTYNQALSARRSRTVSDALVAQGVAGSVISMESRGETQLAKPTADGVREPLNRRATIDINF